MGDLKKFLPGLFLGLLFIGAFCYGVGNLNAEPEKPVPAIQNADTLAIMNSFKEKVQEITAQSRNTTGGLIPISTNTTVNDHANISVIVDSGVKTDSKSGNGKGKD